MIKEAEKSLIKLTFSKEVKNDYDLEKKREQLLRIVKNCRDFQLDHCLDCIEDMIKLVGKDTPISKEVLQHAFTTTKQTREITTLNWNKNQKSFEAFRTETSLIN